MLLEDWSLDKINSPPVNNVYPEDFSSYEPMKRPYHVLGYGFVDNGKTLVLNKDNSKNVIQWKFRSSENYEYDGTRDTNCIHQYGATATASNGNSG